MRASCDFKTEYMVDNGNGCAPCDTDKGMAVSGFGTKCIKDNCKIDEFLNQDDECETCPASYYEVAKKCYNSDRGKIDMVALWDS